MPLKTFTIETIRSWSPCYDPSRYLPEDWTGTALDILKHAEIPAQDKAWVVLRDDLITERIFRLFAVSCARKALKLVKEPDPRSIEACNVAERFARGEATEAELDAARDAAASASAARDAAASASAARDAAAAAAASAAWSAADAAWSAARSASRSAADAARDAADAARDAAAAASAADAAASDAARDAQIQILIELIEGDQTHA